MKRDILLLAVAIGLGSIAYAQRKDYPITAVPFTSVSLDDRFWLPRIKTNNDVTIPASFERCESTGRVKNFEMAAARSGKFCTVYPFDDTDIYKTIEGASFSLRLFPDKKLELYMDSLITKVAAAQEPDGYLYTARTIDPLHAHKWAGKERWERESELSHELYNSGHLYEAAVAHFQATGKRNLLDIAIKNADLVCSVFGPGKRHISPGHQVVEMGLVKLYRVTGKKEYLETAKDFLEARGHHVGYDSTSKDPFRNGSYWQDHDPVLGQSEAVGHAVRAMYMYSAMADIAALTNDARYVEAVDRIWENMVGKKMYLQGGIGAVGNGERFGEDYELPNATAYNETCAAIGNVYWNQRMFQLHGESKYIDILERTLYNGLLSGVGMDGKSFFYTNAMEMKHNARHPDAEAKRSGWFTCSCCPTNVTRLIPSVPGYMYAQNGDNIYINLFATSKATILLDKTQIQISQENNYPWEGKLKFRIDPSSPRQFNIRLRLPGWAIGQAVPSTLYKFADTTRVDIPVMINGQSIKYTIDKGYAVLSRKWKKGDVVEMNLPMEVKTVLSNEKLVDNVGKTALQRGPLVYCAESPDNEGEASNLILKPNASFTSQFKPDLLNGVTVINADAIAIKVDASAISTPVTSKPVKLTAIPYYAWAHRGEGEMVVWLPQRLKHIDILTK